MSTRQYVACKFSAGDSRAYTYHNDGPPLAIGDKVEVESRGGGRATVQVSQIVPEAPRFATKPILGKARLAEAHRQGKGMPAP